jgi:hypothetical protein
VQIVTKRAFEDQAKELIDDFTKCYVALLDGKEAEEPLGGNLVGNLFMNKLPPTCSFLEKPSTTSVSRSSGDSTGVPLSKSEYMKILAHVDLIRAEYPAVHAILNEAMKSGIKIVPISETEPVQEIDSDDGGFSLAGSLA